MVGEGRYLRQEDATLSTGWDLINLGGYADSTFSLSIIFALFSKKPSESFIGL